ncbi:DMT family transporter [Agrilactobacillus fermenti]|uniref:DMT family transporter n=1 Tax=Agrilactobacillus fermenti TaxID=2586909 RepID=UPI001E3DB00C|nr:multidrug efflux SMR transporter [Agrilactobacillus fermenti]MCD2256760.1 multidrug efflux SMR transporter [Agrilactobacillus fermenti]
MDWFLLIIAGFCELGFIAFVSKAQSSGKRWYSLIAMAFVLVSITILSIVTKTVPLGIAYAVWTGIGAISSVAYGVLVLKESFNWLKGLFVLMIIAGVVGLRLFGEG